MILYTFLPVEMRKRKVYVMTVTFAYINNYTKFLIDYKCQELNFIISEYLSYS